jgi:hypothetical protein
MKSITEDFFGKLFGDKGFILENSVCAKPRNGNVINNKITALFMVHLQKLGSI